MTSLESFLDVAQEKGGDSAPTLIWPERIKHLSASALGMFRRC